MLGAIAGDMIGQPYEFITGMKTMDFDLLQENRNRFTDDSVMTIAVAKGILDAGKAASVEELAESMKKNMVLYGRRHSDVGYGRSFFQWLHDDCPKPYNSWGNGSAMRVSAVAWIFADDLEKALETAKASAALTHNHPEGIKGAVCTVHVIWMALNGFKKEDIRKTVRKQYYDWKESCDETRAYYKFDVSCQGTVPVAVQCFLEGHNYEEVVRLAVSMGGDSDTLACIAGSMAEAYYGMPYSIKKKACRMLSPDLALVVDQFETYVFSEMNH